jgi:competence protein ComFC
MVGLALSNIGKAALDILYPPRCVICAHHGDFLCTTCFGKLPQADGPRCDVCWLPVWSESCRACNVHQPAFTALRSVFRYAEDVRTLVHAFKYRGLSCLSPLLAAPMVDAVFDAGLEADLIVAVPMTGMRQRQRGYNQASLLARELGRALDLPVSDALRRRRFAGQQARSATADQRRRNVEGAFEVSKPQIVAGARVLIVDDIATTGATLDACARALLDAGARDVVAVTLARED